MNRITAELFSCCAGMGLLCWSDVFAQDLVPGATPVESCGPEALRTALHFLDANDLDAQISWVLRSSDLHTLLELKQAAERLGLATLCVKVGNVDSLPREMPCIVPISRPGRQVNHFAVLVYHGRGLGSLVDYPFQPHLVVLDRMKQENEWDGTCLVFGQDE